MTMYTDWLHGLSTPTLFSLYWGAVVFVTLIRAFTRRLTPYFTWHAADDPPGQNTADRIVDWITSRVIDLLWLAIIVIAIMATYQILAS